jgi:hypothetical protein
MAHSSPISTRRKETKANKSPFASLGTKKARQQTRDLIVSKAASDLMAMAGDDDKAPYGSMQQILNRYSTYPETTISTQKAAARSTTTRQWPSKVSFCRPSSN